MSHKRVHKTLNNGALGLAETLLLVTSGGMGHEDGELSLEGNVVNERDVGDLDIIETPVDRGERSGERKMRNRKIKEYDKN